MIVSRALAGGGWTPQFPPYSHASPLYKDSTPESMEQACWGLGLLAPAPNPVRPLRVSPALQPEFPYMPPHGGSYISPYSGVKRGFWCLPRGFGSPRMAGFGTGGRPAPRPPTHHPSSYWLFEIYNVFLFSSYPPNYKTRSTGIIVIIKKNLSYFGFCSSIYS